jgi:phosphate transport system permease protein
MLNRIGTDIFFKHLFRMAALISVLALGAILLFVFAQGISPFFVPTARNIRLVAQRIDELSVNGELYRNHAAFIDVPRDVSRIAVRFQAAGGGEETLDITVNTDIAEKNWEKRLNFSASNENCTVTSPESYVYTASWPGMVAALERKLHVILPEPPYSAAAFLGGLEWKPAHSKVFGVFPMIAGTILAGLGAVLLGVPVALLCALFMAEFLPERAAAIARAGIELLAGIPSVVYGFFGLIVIVPAVRNAFRIASGNTLLSAIIVLALMILPTVITIAETSLRAVPLSVREASLALGASKMQTAWRVALPHAHSGVIAGIILGISRAVGETMAVILVAGNSPQLTVNPLESARTLTATIAMEMGYASGRHSEMLFSIGAVLFIIILILNSAILRFRRRMEEA